MSQTKAQLIDNLVQPITGALGSASAPTFSFTSDPNTGIYSPGADQLAISTGGSGRLFVDASGKVFINEDASPTTNVSANVVLRNVTSGADVSLGIINAVPSDANATVKLKAGQQTRNGGEIVFGRENGYEWGTTTNADGYIAFSPVLNNSNTERLRITSAGLVGIGTSSPADILHLSNAGDLYLRVANTSTGINAYLGQDSNGTYIGNTGAAAVRFIQGASERMRLDTSGRLGIGTQTPSSLLHVQGTGNPVLLESTNDAYALGIKGTGTTSTAYLGCTSTNALNFYVSGAERARIDSAGRWLLGTSSSINNVYVGGASYQSPFQVIGNAAGYGNGLTSLNYSAGGYGATLTLGNSKSATVGVNGAVANGDDLGIINFVGNDGTNFRTGAYIIATVDGTPGTADLPTRLTFWTTADAAASPAERLRIDNLGILIKYGDTTTARIIPQTDNAGYIGQASNRWQAIYAVNGTIQTSDAREKTDIVDSPLGADFIRSLRPVAYKWKIGGYTSTYGEDGKETITPNPGVRTHYGFIAQEVKQAVGETDFGGWLQEDLADPDSKQSLRLHEFISPIVKALQEALDEIDNLKAKVAALESA